MYAGEMLREDFLKPPDLSVNALAMALRVPATRIGAIVHEKRGITAHTALRLSRYFGTDRTFWMNLQTRCDLDVAEDAAAEEIKRDVRPRSAAADLHRLLS
jgi:addiction module HigA family antidote